MVIIDWSSANRELSKDGYVILRKMVRGKSYRKQEHIWVYENYHGVIIPKGYEIHHIDRVRNNNNISNLELLSRGDHKKVHYGFKRNDDGSWCKTCPHCGEEKRYPDDFYKRNNVSRKSWCKNCCIQRCMLSKDQKNKQARESYLKNKERNYAKLVEKDKRYKNSHREDINRRARERYARKKGEKNDENK
jgi:hypothetical protein